MKIQAVVRAKEDEKFLWPKDPGFLCNTHLAKSESGTKSNHNGEARKRNLFIFKYLIHTKTATES